VGPLRERRRSVLSSRPCLRHAAASSKGFDTGSIPDASASIVAQFRLTSGLQGAVTSMVLVGAMIGSAVGGLLADKFGRRTMLIACGATFCAGVLIEVVSSGILGLLLGRVIAGLAIGIAYSYSVC
jgi:MFS family permease